MCPFREKNPPHPDLENNAAHSGGRPGLFSMQAPTGCLQKEKSSSNPHNRQAMMFICNHEVYQCLHLVWDLNLKTWCKASVSQNLHPEI